MSAFTLPGLSEHAALEALTIADADRFRIVVQRDADADGPLQWGNLEMIRTRTGGIGRSDFTPDTSDPLGLRRALRHMAGEEYPGGLDLSRVCPSSRVTDAIADAAIRWARVFRGVTVVRVDFSVDQSTWIDGLAYLASESERGGHLSDQQQALDGEVAAFRQWARGEVYSVALQRDASEDGSGDWVDVGDLPTIGGCYLETGEGAYTAADAVAEHWGVPIDFAHAVTVVDGEGY